MSTLHIVYRAGADAVRTVLADAPHDDLVLEFADPLNVGPLYDYDAGAADRAAFWRLVESDDSWREVQENDLASAAELQGHPGPVVVWRGPHPLEFLLSLRAAYLLRESEAPLSEAVRVSSRRGRAAFYDAVSIARPAELAPLLQSYRPVADRERRASHWEAIARNRSTVFRELDGPTVRELRADAYDKRIADACSDAWKDTSQVIGEVLANTGVGDGIISWRLRCLVDSGVLNARGAGPFGPVEVSLARPRR